MRKTNWLLCGLLILLGGCSLPSFLVTPVESPNELDEVTIKPADKMFAGKVAVIEVEGSLMDERAVGIYQSNENPLSVFTEELEMAGADPSVKAVVLRVNSPGGSVTTSDTMYEELKKFRDRTHKPVVASAQEVMASGAYYVSCGADKIVVTPTSIVGSIGVIFESVDVKGTMDKLGIQIVDIKSAELKDMGSPFKHMTDHEREVMQAMVDEYYARFKNVVTSNRPVRQDDLATLTDGRVFTGGRAVALGLADQEGRLDDAIDLARELGHAPKAAIIMYKRPYGYAGSIYADTNVAPPQASNQVNQLNVKLPLQDAILPGGFYYLWQPSPAP